MSASGQVSLVPRRQPHVVARRLRESGVLVNLKTNDIFELNDSAMRVWELVDGATAPDAIASTLVAEFAVTPQVATQQTADILARFRTQGVVC